MKVNLTVSQKQLEQIGQLEEKLQDSVNAALQDMAVEMQAELLVTLYGGMPEDVRRDLLKKLIRETARHSTREV